MDTYQPVIGLEIHVELKTKSKMFCGCKNDPFHAPKPNMYTCPVCLGLPGALPVPNKQAIEWTIRLGLALGCDIPLVSKFDRKNYFYPDLPKGFQISQYDEPLAINGSLRVKNQASKSQDKEEEIVRIRRVHLEEDTGKLMHKRIDGTEKSLVDFNRSGVPLVEIVTEPDIVSGEHAKEFLKRLHQVIVDLDISDAEMSQGSMRLEPNISVRKIENRESKIENSKLPPYKVEVKNINSFNFVKKAIDFEVERHIKILEEGKIPKQETRGWQEERSITVSQRSKEEAQDYRYFPEPDIPPLRWKQSYIDSLRVDIPELGWDRAARFIKEYGITENMADLATITTARTALLDETIARARKNSADIAPKIFVDWIVNKKIDESVTPEEFVEKVSEEYTVEAVDETDVTEAIDAVIQANPKAVSDFKSGKEQVVGFLFGQLMKELKGKGDKKKLMEELIQALERV